MISPIPRGRSKPFVRTAKDHVRTKKLLEFPCLFAVTLLAAFSVIQSEAEDLWVDRNSLGGSCINGGSLSENSPENPWCTIGEAANNATPGDTVIVREGKYTETHYCDGCWGLAVLQPTVSGTSEHPIRFVAERGEKVVISGEGGATYGLVVSGAEGSLPAFVVFEGFTIRDFPGACVQISDTSRIVLSDLEITECSNNVVALLRSSHITVEGCRIHHNAIGGWTSALNFWACGIGNVARGNQIWANTDEHPAESEGHGIIADNCEDTGNVLIENNVIWHNEGICINIFLSDNAIVRNNTCWMNGLGRSDSTELFLLGENARFSNNILVSRLGSRSLKIDSVLNSQFDLTTISTDHNIVWSPESTFVLDYPPGVGLTLSQYQQANPYGWETNSIQTDPRLLDPTASMFTIPAASPAVDSGSPESASQRDIFGFWRPLDGDGDGRATVDRGAYEYGGIFRNGFERNERIPWSKEVP